MKILLLITLVALAAGDVSHLLKSGYQYQQPSFQPPTSYAVPQSSVLGSLDGSGSIPSVSYSGSGASVVPQLSLPNAAGPTVTFNSGSSISGATIQTYENGGFSTPVPLTQDALASFQASTPAPSLGVSSFPVSQPQSLSASAPLVNLVNYHGASQPPAQKFFSPLREPSVSGSFGSDSQLNAGLGFGGAASFSADSQLNAGLGLGGSKFFSKSEGTGGNINEAFGVATDAAAGFGVSQHAEGSLEPEISKHLYFFDAPEDEEEELEAKVHIPPVAPKKTYKIIFIKAPTYRNQGTITIPAPPPTEEKTLVYVLVKKPEKNANVRFQPAAPTKPSKPEVFFIKYKTQQEAEAAVAEIQNKHGATGQVIANLPAGKSIDHIDIPLDIGSTSSPSFGGSESRGFGGDSFDSIGDKKFSSGIGGDSFDSIGAKKFSSGIGGDSFDSIGGKKFFSGIGGDSFDSIGAKKFSSSGASSFSGFSARAGVDDSQQPDDSASAQSENEQTNLHFEQVSTSEPSRVSFGLPSVSSTQDFSGAVSFSQSEASPSEVNKETQSNVDSGDSDQDSDSKDDASKDDSSSSQPEQSENDEYPGIQERIDTASPEAEAEGSNLSAFKTYGAPDPSLFKKYGPPEA